MADKLTQKLKKEEFDGDKIRKPQITSLYNVKEVSPSKKNSTKAGFENNGETSHNSAISQSEAYVKLEQRVYVDYDKQKQIETKTERKQAVDNATNEIIEKLEKLSLKTIPVTHSINRNLGFSNYFYVEEVRKGRRTLIATTMWKKMSVQFTAESIRNSVSPNAQSDTDINIIPNPNTDVKIEQRAYAASRIDYEKPSLEVIGTGEGA